MNDTYFFSELIFDGSNLGHIKLFFMFIIILNLYYLFIIYNFPVIHCLWPSHSHWIQGLEEAVSESVWWNFANVS